ncbi:MAG: cobalamin-dependent protein [Candidatus Helarchaeota archaeon]
MAGPIRVLMSKPGIDGHWRGIVVVSRGLRDAGMEVIFGGFQTCEQIVETAIEEDVDMIGLSIHSGAHIGYTKRVVDLLKEKGLNGHFLLLVGGAIPSKDFEVLKEIGAANVYGPGSLIKDIVAFIKEHVKK